MDIQDIIRNAREALARDPRVCVFNPRIRFENGTLLLDGAVNAFWKSAVVESLVRDAAGCCVENNLIVFPTDGCSVPKI